MPQYYSDRKLIFRWIVPPTKAYVELLNEYQIQVINRLLSIARKYAMEMETYARLNAPWKDITGLARNSLFAFVVHTASAVVIVLKGSAYYQMFLELRNAGRYAIIAPTIDLFGPRIMAEVGRSV